MGRDPRDHGIARNKIDILKCEFFRKPWHLNTFLDFDAYQSLFVFSVLIFIESKNSIRQYDVHKMVITQTYNHPQNKKKRRCHFCNRINGLIRDKAQI